MGENRKLERIEFRGTAKKRQVTVNGGTTFAITEFKPRISSRGRKKLTTVSKGRNS